MQEVKFQNNSLPSEYLKQKEFKTCSLNDIYQKNFVHGLQNARNILASLERSIEKSSAYEDRLLLCKATHKHSHDKDWSWDTDFSSEKDFQSTKTNLEVNKTIPHQDPVNLIESWSTMSIVVLQFQYEELSKRYESLLKAFNDKCGIITAKKATIARLRRRATIIHAQLASAHRALLCVGEKYMAMKKRRQEQLQQYDRKIQFLKGRVREVVMTAESARVHLDQKLSRNMAMEKDFEYAMLLAEMKKCNQLFLENLKLKAQLEEYIPGSVNWNN